MVSAGALLLALWLSSCATPPPPPEVLKAPMDFAMDTGGGRMFYRGIAEIPRSFGSATPFELDVDVTYWGNPAADDTGAAAHKALGMAYRSIGVFQPLENSEGVISLAAGRLQLRGKVLNKGQELDGDWFFDGKAGGGFRIARKGYLFP